MSNKILEKIASDLNVFRYSEETIIAFECRLLYSALASWIKAITLDQPVSSRSEGFSGVSRRHISDRSRSIFETMCKMFPDTEKWFFDGKEHPTNIIRTRLINHGDLLNEGFDSNLALSTYKKLQITDVLGAVYGVVMDENVAYSGISTICHEISTAPNLECEDYLHWFTNYLKEAAWFNIHINYDSWQYFNPCLNTSNNYSAWQDAIPQEVDDIIFARIVINKNSYEYYLIKNKGELYHKMDPFSIVLGYHRRIMFILRSKKNNNAKATIKYFEDHVLLHLYTHLPLEENNLIECYAWPVKNIEDRLEWVMDKDMWKYIKPHIQSLKIRIEGE